MTEIKFPVRDGPTTLLVKVEVVSEDNGKRLAFNMPYCPPLQAEIKAMEGARWHGYDKLNPRKVWTIANSARNKFRIDALRWLGTRDGKPILGDHDPYARYSAPLVDIPCPPRPYRGVTTPYYSHQPEGVNFVVTRRQCILAWDMGCVSGDAKVHVNRAGKGSTITLRELHKRWHGHHTRQAWSTNDVVTNIRSMVEGGRLRQQPMLNVLNKGWKETIKIETASGRSIVVTPDHEMAITMDGTFVRADALRSGDKIVCTSTDDAACFDTVKSVTPNGVTDVYDVVCPDPHHNFVASGFVVHNCGKTLVIGRAMEWAKETLGWVDEDFWYVCKNGALYQVMLDYDEWAIGVRPRFLSYEAMKSALNSWPKGKQAPKFVVFDESSCIKSPNAQRSEAALHLADSMRAEHGPECFVVLMTGTPAPKNPCDWWMQCEVACPGFVREGDWHKFRKRLAVVEQQTRGGDGGIYNTVKKDSQGNQAWFDDERRCKTCGELEVHQVHSELARMTGQGHPWAKSVNEVLLLDKRLRGFVSKKFKKDCLDLPDRVYRVIKCQPTLAAQNAARLIAKAARGAADALTRLRELSDGFQYQDQTVETKQCSMCAGSGTMVAKQDPENPGIPPSDEALRLGRLEDYVKQCDECQGSGEVDIKARVTARVTCPKDDVLEDLLQEHEDVGRLPIYCGFTGSVDRVVDICLKNKWHVIRVDGRGWHGFIPEGGNPLPAGGQQMYQTFRFDLATHPKVAFVAQASTAAHGLNFDCAPTIVNFSRDFNFENAMQGDERNLRGRIAETLRRTGRTKVEVVDIVHLESDAYILENHKRKRRLQALTLGEVQAALGG